MYCFPSLSDSLFISDRAAFFTTVHTTRLHSVRFDKIFIQKMLMRPVPSTNPIVVIGFYATVTDPITAIGVAHTVGAWATILQT
jgi:hypothetical protein